MLENDMSGAPLNWSAVRSAIAANCLHNAGRLRLRVYGESMLPALWPGDVVEVAACSLDQVRAGEILLAERDGQFFMHRLIDASPAGGFILLGDSMPRPDPPFPSVALLGRLVHRADDGRRLKDAALHPGFGAKLSRAVGVLLCHFRLARRIALNLRSRRNSSAKEIADAQPRPALSSNAYRS